jgi:hypothetical protein
MLGCAYGSLGVPVRYMLRMDHLVAPNSAYTGSRSAFARPGVGSKSPRVVGHRNEDGNMSHFIPAFNGNDPVRRVHHCMEKRSGHTAESLGSTFPVNSHSDSAFLPCFNCVLNMKYILYPEKTALDKTWLAWRDTAIRRNNPTVGDGTKRCITAYSTRPDPSRPLIGRESTPLRSLRIALSDGLSMATHQIY